MPRRVDRVARLEALLPPPPAADELHDLVKLATFGECCAAQAVLLRHDDVAAAMRDPTMALLFTAARARLAGQTVPDLFPDVG